MFQNPNSEQKILGNSHLKFMFYGGKLEMCGNVNESTGINYSTFSSNKFSEFMLFKSTHFGKDYQKFDPKFLYSDP